MAIQSSWGTFAAAGMYVVALGGTLCRTPFWRKTVRELRRRPPRLPEVSELNDPETKDLLARVRAAREYRAGRLGRVDYQSRARLESLVESIVDLEATAVRLLLAADKLACSLADGAGTRVFARTKVLASRAEEATDPEVGEELLRASQTAGQHADVVAQLAAHERKLVARVDWIVETLDLLSSSLLATEVGTVLAELDSQGVAIDDVTADIESLRFLSKEREIAASTGHGESCRPEPRARPTQAPFETSPEIASEEPAYRQCQTEEGPHQTEDDVSPVAERTRRSPISSPRNET